MVDNQYGTISSLELDIVNKEGRTCLNHAEFTAPFKVIKPFYIRKNSNEVMQLMLISVSAGIMAGDVQEIKIRTGSQTFSEFTSQSYEKIHKMPDGEAVRKTRLYIGEDSFCHYKPLPVIPFAGSSFVQETEIELKGKRSMLVYREIISGGRGASGEVFAYQNFENKVIIRRQGQLLYYDNTILEPESMDMSGYGMLEGYTHMGNMICCNLSFTPGQFKQIRQDFVDGGICGGISRLDGDVVLIRVFGIRSDDVIRCFDRIYEEV